MPSFKIKNSGYKLSQMNQIIEKRLIIKSNTLNELIKNLYICATFKKTFDINIKQHIQCKIKVL